MKFHHDTPKVQKLEDMNHFLYIDKCHNSVINHGNLPINNPQRDIVGANAIRL